jgi:hypothetical protein
LCEIKIFIFDGKYRFSGKYLFFLKVFIFVKNILFCPKNSIFWKYSFWCENIPSGVKIFLLVENIHFCGKYFIFVEKINLWGKMLFYLKITEKVNFLFGIVCFSVYFNKNIGKKKIKFFQILRTF